MNNLKRHKFSDLYDISSGISSKKEQAGHGAPFLSFSTVFNNHFIPEELNEKMDTSEEEQEKYSIKAGDIFLTRTSETLDELGMSSVAVKDYPQATYSGFLKRLRPKQSDVTYHKYLAFYLRGYLFRKSMNYKAVMTLRASLNEKIFSYLDLLLPEYSQQKKIGDFLYHIEEKIELNKKINKELESMAKLIYDYWFIQFDFPDENGKPYKSTGGKMAYNKELKRKIPNGWKVQSLGDLCDLYQPKTISEKDLIVNGEFPVFGANGIVGYYNKYNHEDSVVAVTCRGNTCGNILRTLPKAWITGNAMVVNSKRSEISTEFIFQMLHWIGIEKSITGSAQPQITRSNLAMLKCLVPDDKTLKKFNEFIKPQIKKRLENENEISFLTKLRDWLLPMLINGQISVKESENELAIAAEPDTEYKPTNKPTNVDFYRRTVLAAEIVWQLHQQPTLGHVKLQKIIYLAKQTSSMMLPTNFLKQAAGPYDPQMARSIDKQLKKNKWFEFQKDEFLKYKPLEKAGEHKADFNKYFHEEKENIQFFIDTFKKAKTDKVEIIATLYACWKELTEKGKTVTDDVLIEQFYNWSEKKAKFKQERLLKAINWMRDEGVCPVS